MDPACLGVQCPAGQECLGGRCLPKQCGSATCQSGLVCLAGRCVTSECAAVTCAVGEVCAGGLCLPRTCQGVECPATAYCEAGSCHPVQCASVQCGAGQVCAAGQCLPSGCGGQACGTGEVCALGVCQGALCVGVVCPAGESCIAGACTSLWDADGDGVANSLDNCDVAYNPSQDDTDRDLAGDVCDCAPASAAAWPGAAEVCGDGLDNDCDGLGDCADSECAASCVLDAGFVCPPEDGGTDAGGLDAGPRWHAVLGIATYNSYPILGRLWASAEGQIWVDGGGSLLWNGSSLSSVAGPVPAWGTSATDLWATSGDGLSHWNGTSWTSLRVWPLCGKGPTLTDVFGSSHTDVWATGEWGILFHFDGVSWRHVPGLGANRLNAGWAAGPTDVWVVGEKSTILRWNGNRWATVANPLSNASYFGFHAVWGSSETDVWAGGTAPLRVLHWNGSAWAEVAAPIGIDPSAIWGRSSSEVWFANPAGSSLFWNGTDWTVSSLALNDVHGTPGGTWGTSGRTLVRWNGQDWELLYAPSTGPGADLSGFTTLFVSGSGTAWSIGRSPSAEYVVSWDGGSATIHDAGFQWLSSISGSSDSDIWAINDGMCMHYHWNGTDWTESCLANWYTLIWSTGPSDVWTAAVTGAVRQWNGVSWTNRGTAGAPLYGLWGDSSTNVWVVGNSGKIRQWTGAWQDHDAGSAYWSDVWGLGSTEVWVVGTEQGSNTGRIVRWNGSEWSDMTFGSCPPASKVHGSSNSNVWVSAGASLHAWNGQAWATVAPPFEVSDLWVETSTRTWVAGPAGLAHTVP